MPSPLDVCAPAQSARVGAFDLEHIFREKTGELAGLVLRLVGRDDDVDDIVQETFILALRKIEQLKDPTAIGGWLAAIAVRLARRRLKKRRLRRFLGLDSLRGYDALVDPSASPEDRALLGQMYVMLDQLPSDQRIAWTLRYVENEQLGAVAELCGCSLATVKRRITSAQAVLERGLADVGKA